MPPKRKAAKKATPTPLRNPTRSSRTTKKLVDGDDDDSDAAEDDYSPIDQQSIASRRASYPRRRATERKIERFSPGEDDVSSSAPRQSPRSSRRKAARRATSPQSSAGRGTIDPNRLLLEYLAAAKVAGIKAFLEKEASKPNTKKSKATVINQVCVNDSMFCHVSIVGGRATCTGAQCRFFRHRCCKRFFPIIRTRTRTNPNSQSWQANCHCEARCGTFFSRKRNDKCVLRQRLLRCGPDQHPHSGTLYMGRVCMAFDAAIEIRGERTRLGGAVSPQGKGEDSPLDAAHFLPIVGLVE